MMTSDRENAARIRAVENSFGALGRSLSIAGRVLVGQGRLMKQGRQGDQPKTFFLFNDVLVYGSIILAGCWHKKQKIIPLEDIQLEDMEDSWGMRNQWLIRTPRKSFFVSAPSVYEKHAWIKHIEECRTNLLQGASRQPGSTFAVTWIPDQSAFKCMRCFKKFTVTNRRHHCRKCGFLVCEPCSKKRVRIENINRHKKVRVCRTCYPQCRDDEISWSRGDSPGGNCSEEKDVAASIDEQGGNGMLQMYSQSTWLEM